MREWNIRQFYWEEETDTQSHFWSAIKWRDNANFLSVHARFVNAICLTYSREIKNYAVPASSEFKLFSLRHPVPARRTRITRDYNIKITRIKQSKYERSETRRFEISTRESFSLLKNLLQLPLYQHTSTTIFHAISLYYFRLHPDLFASPLRHSSNS